MKKNFCSIFSNYKILVNFYDCSKNVHCKKFYCSLSAKNKQTVAEPVKLSYVSYESTDNETEPPPLIIMHGIFGSKANWTTTSRKLHKQTVPKRKIIVVDARNHGDSPHSPFHTYEHLAEDIKQLMGEMGLKKAALMGHSMGGRTMMFIALKYPQFVEKLITVDISPFTTDLDFKGLENAINAMKRVTFPSSVSLEEARKSADIQLSITIHNKMVRNFLLTNILQESNGKFSWRVNIPALWKNRKNIFSFPTVSGMSFNGPATFIGGKESGFMRESDHSKILELFPKAQFNYIEKAGHWVHSEKPREFVKLCIEFLNKK